MKILAGDAELHSHPRLNTNLSSIGLVGVAAFLGSEVVLAPFASLHVGCMCDAKEKRAEERNHPNLPTSI